MTLEEALTYLTPHHGTSDSAAIMLTTGKMREAVAAIHSEFRRREMQSIGDALRNKFYDGA